MVLPANRVDQGAPVFRIPRTRLSRSLLGPARGSFPLVPALRVMDREARLVEKTSCAEEQAAATTEQAVSERFAPRPPFLALSDATDRAAGPLHRCPRLPKRRKAPDSPPYQGTISPPLVAVFGAVISFVTNTNCRLPRQTPSSRTTPASQITR